MTALAAGDRRKLQPRFDEASMRVTGAMGEAAQAAHRGMTDFGAPADERPRGRSPWIAVVALLLLAVLRSSRASFGAVLPVAMATGWAGLIAFIFGFSLNPLSATLGALLVALLGQVTAWLSDRYLEARKAGLAAAEAIREA